MNTHSAVAIISEIDDIKRFKSREKLASYSSLTSGQNQSDCILQTIKLLRS